MKTGIHPKYQDAEITCACGSKFTAGSVKEKIEIEICASCHPFYTGLDKVLDTTGRVDRFNKRFAKSK